jgi:polysaccharide pyruvyl transferase WcaK-like protein
MKIAYPKTTMAVNPSYYHEYPKNQLKKINNLAKPIALVCGYYGKKNIGDELMLQSIINNLSEKYRIIVASYDPVFTQIVHNIEAVPHHHQYFDRVLQQSQLVIIGGGTLIHDQGLEKNRNIEYYTNIINRAKTEGKRVVILGVGVDKIILEKNIKLIKENFPKCEKIYLRDQASAQNLRDIGIDHKLIEVIPDLIFGNEYKKSPKVTSDRTVIGINLCPSVINSGIDVKEKVDKILTPFIKDNAEKFSFVFIPGLADDLQLYQYLSEQTGTKILLMPFNENYFGSYENIFEKIDVLIASRFHLLLLGLIHEIKVYSVSYAEKTENLRREFMDRIEEFTGLINLKKKGKTDLSKLKTTLKQIFQQL